MQQRKTLILIPTYNERENAEKLCLQIIGSRLDADILFLDDNSPDGTGEILDRLTRVYPNVQVMHRPSKLGIGTAHLDGIKWAYEHNYTTLITMDCDFTHLPMYLPDFIEHSSDNDVVVGSRYLLDESLQEWSLLRKTLTLVGHLLTRTLLRMKYDATGAYRAYRLDIIPPEAFGLVQSRGYSFFYESLYILHRNKFRIKEFPIVLPARTYGHSKMRFTDAFNSLSRLLKISLKTLFNRSEYEVPDPSPVRNDASRTEDISAWDAYWNKSASPASHLYSGIAQLYRKHIIKKNLNQMVGTHFPQGARVLHAGCGSGQVDTDIPGGLAVAALDISDVGLQIYRSVHKNECDVIRGSIFDIPLGDESVDGVYHLGLLEHFTEEEIHRSFLEFGRILRPGAKMIVFWPPRFGLSVNVLKVAHFVLNTLLHRNVKLHPDEITLVKSKKHAVALFENADFKLVNYYFGSRDLFTQCMIVVEKTTTTAALRSVVEEGASAEVTIPI